MKKFWLNLMILLYIAAGINHFMNPAMYMGIMPPWITNPALMVLISGIAEIACGLLLFFPATRRFGAWSLIILLIAIFPANIQMLLNYLHENNPGLWVTIARLPLQIVLIWWAYRYTKQRRPVKENV